MSIRYIDAEISGSSPYLFPKFRECCLVSISKAQRHPAPGLRWIETVYHGLLEDLYAFQERQGDYLVYVGRISREKRVG